MRRGGDDGLCSPDFHLKLVDRCANIEATLGKSLVETNMSLSEIKKLKT